MTELFIFLDKWYKLDIDQNTAFDIQYSLADVKDFTKRNISYTKTVLLPGTKENNKIIQYIYDLNKESNSLLEKIKCYVTKGNVEIFTGFLQFLNINNDDGYITYEVSLSSDIIDIVSKLENINIDEIDLSELDHEISYNQIVSSWDKNYTSGYYYPLIDYNFNWNFNSLNTKGVTGSNMLPALYVKYLWDKLFQINGISYDSKILNSDIFKSLIIPCSSKQTSFGSDFIRKNVFRVSTSNSYIIEFDNVISGAEKEFIELQSSDKKVKLDNESSPNFDYNDLFDTTTYEFINKSNNVNNKFKVDIDITINKKLLSEGIFFFRILRGYDGGVATVVPTTKGVSFKNYNVLNFGFVTTYSFDYQIYPMIGTSALSRTIANISTLFDETNLIEDVGDTNEGYVRYRGSVESIFLDGSNPSSQPLGLGEKLWIEIDVAYTKEYLESSVLPILDNGGYSLKINSCSLYNTPAVTNLDGTRSISMSSILPKNYKAINFFNDIVKMFNLFIEVDKDDPTNLIIETRNDYYDSPTIRNWTNKVDLSKGTKIELISNKENNTMIFTYKNDSDLYNQDYNKEFNRVYGDYTFNSKNENTKSDKKIELGFSPTINRKVPNSTSFILPIISSNSGTPGEYVGSNMRILFKNVRNRDLTNDTWKLDGITQSSYPYAGMIDNIDNPSVFLGFGVPSFIYEEINTFPINNLFSLYWEDMLDELMSKDGRLYTLSVHLTPEDIRSFSFKDLIYLEVNKNSSNNYFRVNKISYNPNVVDSYEVELLLAKDLRFDFPESPFFCSDFSIISGGTTTSFELNSGTSSRVRKASLIYPISFSASIDSNSNFNDKINTFNVLDLSGVRSSGFVTGQDLSTVSAIKIDTPSKYEYNLEIGYTFSNEYINPTFSSNFTGGSFTVSVTTSFNNKSYMIPFISVVDNYYAWSNENTINGLPLTNGVTSSTYFIPTSGTYSFYYEVPYSVDRNWTPSGINQIRLQIANKTTATTIGLQTLSAGVNSGTWSGTFSYFIDLLNPSNRNAQIYLIADMTTRRTSGSSVATFSVGSSKFNLIGFEPYDRNMGYFGDISTSLYLVDYDGSLINTGSNKFYKEISTTPIAITGSTGSGKLFLSGSVDIKQEDLDLTTNLYLYPAFKHILLQSTSLFKYNYDLSAVKFNLKADTCDETKITERLTPDFRGDKVTNLTNKTLILGSGNKVYSDGLVVGDDNFVSSDSDNFIISGSNNKIESGSENSAIIGGSGNVLSGTNSIIVGGTNINLNESNITYIGGQVVLENTIIIQGTQSGAYFDKGSTGSYSLRVVNGSTSDAQSDYSISFGEDTIIGSTGSHNVVFGKNNYVEGEYNFIFGKDNNGIYTDSKFIRIFGEKNTFPTYGFDIIESKYIDIFGTNETSIENCEFISIVGSFSSTDNSYRNSKHIYIRGESNLFDTFSILDSKYIDITGENSYTPGSGEVKYIRIFGASSSSTDSNFNDLFGESVLTIGNFNRNFGKNNTISGDELSSNGNFNDLFGDNIVVNEGNFNKVFGKNSYVEGEYNFIFGKGEYSFDIIGDLSFVRAFGYNDGFTPITGSGSSLIDFFGSVQDELELYSSILLSIYNADELYLNSNNGSNIIFRNASGGSQVYLNNVDRLDWNSSGQSVIDNSYGIRVFGVSNILNSNESKYIDIFGGVNDINSINSNLMDLFSNNVNLVVGSSSAIRFFSDNTIENFINIDNSNHIDFFGVQGDSTYISNSSLISISNYDELNINFDNCSNIFFRNTTGGNSLGLDAVYRLEWNGVGGGDMINTQSMRVFGSHYIYSINSYSIDLFGQTSIFSVVNSNDIYSKGFDNKINVGTSSHIYVFGESNEIDVVELNHIYIFGKNGVGSRNGEFVRSLTTSGQKGQVFFWRQTTNRTISEVGLNGSTSISTNRFEIENNSSYRVKFDVVCLEETNGYSKEWEASCLVKTIGGTTSIVGTPSIVSTYGDIDLISADFLLDAQPNYLRVRVQGITSSNINWMINAEYTKVHFNSGN